MIPFLVWPIVTAIAAAVTGAAIASDDSTPSSSSSDRVAETKRRARQKLLADMANDAETTLQGVVSNACEDLRELEMELGPSCRTTASDARDLVRNFFTQNGLSAEDAKANDMDPEQWLERLQAALQGTGAGGVLPQTFSKMYGMSSSHLQGLMQVADMSTLMNLAGGNTKSLWTEINAASKVEQHLQERQNEINALDKLIKQWQD